MLSRILLIRHGVTEMNEYLSTCPYGQPGFIDPGLYDTQLTRSGIIQASSVLRQRLATEHSRDRISTLICSPLSRALATADLGLGDIDLPSYVIEPDIAERRYLSSDVGRSRDALACAYPRFASALMSTLPPNDPWWWVGSAEDEARAVAERRALQGGGELQGVALPVEPNDAFLRRIGRFRDRLVAMPGDSTIAVVAHWGVILALTGESVRNCEVLECTREQLMGELTLPPDD